MANTEAKAVGNLCCTQCVRPINLLLRTMLTLSLQDCSLIYWQNATVIESVINTGGVAGSTFPDLLAETARPALKVLSRPTDLSHQD